ncbi:MAG: Nif11-like leader peptide family natural product precursor [Leptolyngbyaceae cyanobacterium MAG.088]|nr:Nif11-like leader peptide family natural product precursor [Leptolyngbyaceae cyanobacterium MAG.088]
MTNHNVLQFMQKTANNTTLQKQLEQLLGCGDGDISSSVNLDPEESLALSQRAPNVIELAASMGYNFSKDELLTVIDAFHQHQNGTLSEESFAKLLGIDSGESVRPAVRNNFKRLASYLSKTYLGVNLS